MNAIRIRKTIDSDTIRLPELVPLIGRTVDILIEDLSDLTPASPGIVAGTGNWDAVLNAAQQLEDYDYHAQCDQDDRDIRGAQNASAEAPTHPLEPPQAESRRKGFINDLLDGLSG